MHSQFIEFYDFSRTSGGERGKYTDWLVKDNILFFFVFPFLKETTLFIIDNLFYGSIEFKCSHFFLFFFRSEAEDCVLSKSSTDRNARPIRARFQLLRLITKEIEK